MAYTANDIKRLRSESKNRKGERDTSLPSSDSMYTADSVRAMRESMFPSRKTSTQNAYDDYAQMATASTNREYIPQETTPTFRYNSYADYENAINAVKPTGAEKRAYRGKKVWNALANLENSIPVLLPDKRIEMGLKEYTDKEKEYEALTEEFGKYKEDRSNVFNEYKNKYANNADFAEKSKESTLMSGFDQDLNGTSLDLENRLFAYGKMSDEEKQMANYLANTDLKAYWKYISEMNKLDSKEDYEREVKSRQNIIDAYDDDPLSQVGAGALLTTEAVANKMGSAPFVPVEYAFNAVTRAEQNPYGGAAGTSNLGWDTQQIVASKLAEQTGSEVAPFLYNTGVSIGESLLGAKTYDKAYSVLMGTGAFNTSYKELSEKGASDQEIMLGAFLSGAAETVFEYISLDKLLSAKDVSSLPRVFVETLKQAGVEGSEEFFTEASNIITDELTQGANSEVQRMIRDMRNQGFNDEEIKKEITEYLRKRIVEATIGGMISGGALGGTFNAARWAGNNSVGKRTDRTKLQESLNLLNEDSELRKQYGNADLSNLSDAEVGALVQDAYAEASQVDKKAIRKSMKQAFLDSGLDASEAEELTEAFFADNKTKLQKEQMRYKVMTRVVSEVMAKERLLQPMIANLKQKQILSVIRSEEDVAREKSATKMQKNFNIGTENSVKGENVEILDVTKEGKDYVIHTDKGDFHTDEVTMTENTAKALARASTHEDARFREAFIRNYHGQNMGEYETYALNAFKSGENYDGDIIQNQSYEDVLGGTDAVMDFLDAGRQTSESASKEAKANERNTDDVIKEFKGEAKAGQFVDETDYKNLKPIKKDLYNLMRGMSQVVGLNIKVINDPNNTDNGTFDYDEKGGFIMVNLAAKEYTNSSGYRSSFVIPALSHEMTHWMKPNAPEAYNALSDAIKKYLVAEGKNIDVEIEKMIKEYANAPEPVVLDEEGAWEEIVSKACEGMLTEESTMDKILNKMNRKELTGFRAALDKFFNLVKKVLKRLSSRTTNEYAKIVQKYFDEVQNLWTDGIASAIVRQQIINGDAAIDAGVQIDTTTGTVAHSVRTTIAETYEQLGYEKYEDALDFMATSIANQMYEESEWDSKEYKKAVEDAKKWIQAEESISAFILQDVETKKWLDYDADERFKAIKGDTDYPQGTLDLSNRCRKREVFTKIFDNLQTANPNMLFTAEDIAAIRDTLEEAKVETACALCYVEDRRQHLGVIANDFIGAYKEALKSKNKVIMYKNSSGKVAELNATKDEQKAYGIDLYKATDKYVPTQADLITYEGFKNLEKDHPDIAHAFERWNKKRGQASGRLIEGHAEYKRELLKWTSAQIKKTNDLGGFRIFSFSDLEGIHVIDVMQAIIDASVMGIKIQAYTKVPAFAKIVKDTGIKVNLSLIPANVDSKNAYAYVNNEWVKVSDKMVENGIAEVDGKQYLAVDIKEGIDVTSKDFDMYRDNPNIGLEITGISDKQMKLAMADPNIDYIIPFHSNQSTEVLKIKKIDTWHNYKLEQTDTGGDINIYTDVIEKYNVKTKDEFVEAFKKEIKAQKKTARFNRFIEENGYYKTLLDYKLFDANGNILPQENVVPRFDEDTLKFVNEFLAEDMKRSKNMKLSDDVMNMIYNTLAKRGKKVNPVGAKHSLQRDSQGNELTEGQIKKFGKSEAVDEDGDLQVTYHGTVREFYEFDRQFASSEGDWGKGFYFSNNINDVEANYANENGADLTNKIEREADMLEGTEEYEDKSHDEIVEELRKKYITSEPITLECYLDIKNACYPHTWILSSNDVGLSMEDYEDSDDYYEAVDDAFYEYVDELMNKMYEYADSDMEFVLDNQGNEILSLIHDAFGYDGISVREFKENANKRYFEDEYGNLVNNEIVRLVIQALGYDGIIDDSVSKKFKNMEGVTEDTIHYIVFDSNQAKLTSNENPTENPDIRKSLQKEGYAEKDSKTLGLTDERIDKLLSGGWYGASSKNYAQAYIAYMSPDDYLKLTTGKNQRYIDRIKNWNGGFEADGEWDFEKFAEGYNRTPIKLTIDENERKVVGHEGRHRMWQLKQMGYERVPVLMFDYDTKYSKTPKQYMDLTPQSFKDEDVYTQEDTVAVRDVIPFGQDYTEQIKEKFGTKSNADTKFSKQTKGLDVGNAETLKKQNVLLKADVEALKEYIRTNKEITKDTTWNPVKTQSITKNLIEKYHSDIDPNTLRKMLADTYKYITDLIYDDNAFERWSGVMDECYAVATEIYEDIKKKPTISRTQILNELKNANVEGKADMELIGQIQDAVTLATEEDYIRKIGQEIYNSYWKMASLKTDADKQSEAIKKLKAEHRKTVEKLKNENIATKIKYKELLEKARNDRDTKIAELKEKTKAKEAKKKVEGERKKLIERITKVSTDLLTRIEHPEKGKTVPLAMVEPLRNLVRAIDFSSKQLLGIRQGKHAYTPTQADVRMGDLINSVSETLRQVQSQNADSAEAFDLAGLTISPEYADDLQRIANKLNKSQEIIESGQEYTLQLMTLEDLKTLANVLTDIKTNIDNVNRILSMSNAHEVDYIGRAILRYMKSLGTRDIKKLLEFPVKYMTMVNKTPYYFFKHMGEGGQELFELLMEGWDKYSFNTSDIIEFTQNLWQPEQAKKWNTTLHTFEIVEAPTLDDIANGKDGRHRTIQMSESQIMALYCMSKRAQAREHILKGNGIVVDEIKMDGLKKNIQRQRAVTISEADLNNIIKVVEEDEQMKHVADEIQKFMNTTCSKWINEVYFKLHGTYLATEDNYFPISVDQETFRKEAKDKHESLYGLINQSWTKPLKPNARNQVVVSNIFDVFMEHATSTAKYNSLALPVLDIIKVWNYSESTRIGEEGKESIDNVKMAITDAIGKEGNAYISHLLHDINGDSESGRYDDMFMRFIKRSKIAKVGANATTAMLQPLSYERAAYVIDTKYLAEALTKKPQIEKCFNNIGVAKWKRMGFYDTNLTTSLSKIILNNGNFVDKTVEASLIPAEKMDELTWGYLYTAVELECKDRFKNLSQEALDNMVAKRLRKVLYATQVFDSTLSRTDMMRSSSTFTKMWTAFGSEPILSINMLMDAITEFTRTRKKGGTKVAMRSCGAQLMRAGVIYLVSSIVESVIREIASRWKKYDDEDEEFFDGFLESLIKRTIEELNPLNKIPIVKDIISIAKSALKGYSTSNNSLDTEFITSLIDAYAAMIKAVNNREMSYKTMQKILDAISISSGIPIGNLAKEFKSLWNNVVGRFTGWMLK